MAPTVRALRCAENTMTHTVASTSSRISSSFFSSRLPLRAQRSATTSRSREAGKTTGQNLLCSCCASPPLTPKQSRVRAEWTKWRDNTVSLRASSGSATTKPLAGVACKAKLTDVGDVDVETLGEDSAAFSLQKQSLGSWAVFSALLSVVLAGLYVVWIDPDLIGAGTGYIDVLEDTLGLTNPHLVMVGLLVIFGIAHSGLAALRPAGEAVLGKRGYRVGFALTSLPLAFSCLMYFINHRYSGVPLYNIQQVPGVHDLVWMLSFVSFFFLYPSTFNLLEVAAVDVPEVHLWETGVIRITRHPQMVGQVIWSLAHLLWIGNSFTLVTMLGLCGYHWFGTWHGDQRLKKRFGNDFHKLKERTSVWPFLAILDGRQQLPKDYWKEFVRLPYLVVTCFTLGAYLCHPLMQGAAYWLDW